MEYGLINRMMDADSHVENVWRVWLRDINSTSLALNS